MARLELSLPSAEPGVYALECTATGRRYVGQSARMAGRMETHFSDLRAGRHPNRALQQDWKTHGYRCFLFHVLHVVPNPMERVRLERIEIGRHDASSSYNLLHLMPPHAVITDIADTSDDYLTFPAAAKTLMVSEVWLRKMLNAGRVSGAERVAGRWALRKAEFLPWCREYNARPKRAARLTKS